MLLKDAYQSIEAELRSLPESALVPLNTDIVAATATVLARLPRLLSYREQVVRELPHFPIEVFDRLEVVTKAAAWAQAGAVAPQGPNQALRDRRARLAAIRATFLADLRALSQRGLVDLSALGELRHPQGFENAASQVATLVAFLRQHWATIEHKTAITAGEIEEAKRLADQMTYLLGWRHASKSDVGPQRLLRHQAFTLFVRTYDEVRRALSYLRWHARDVDTIAPSVTGRRHGSRNRRTLAARPAA
jgi:hypothetical protein